MDIYSKFDVIVSDSGGPGRERRGGVSNMERGQKEALRCQMLLCFESCLDSS